MTLINTDEQMAAIVAYLKSRHNAPADYFQLAGACGYPIALTIAEMLEAEVLETVGDDRKVKKVRLAEYEPKE